MEMEAKFYDTLETWEKRSLTTSMNDICRDHVMSKGWGEELTDEQYHFKVMNIIATNRHIFNADRMSYYSGTELSGIINELTERLKGKFKTYGAKEPTPRQIYFYVDLCLRAGESPQHILSNSAIGREITRLKAEIEMLESEDIA